MARSYFANLLSLILLTSFASAAFADAHLQNARKLFTAGDAEGAYHLLEAQQGEWAGNSEFDQLLAKSAAESGRYTEAIFAYERLLAVTPDNVDAWYQLARIYYRLGERENALRTYESVRLYSPSTAIEQSVQKDVAALEAGIRFNPTQVRGFLGASFGYDSNVNSATSDSVFALPGLGGGVTTVLPTSSLEQSDNFAMAVAGLTIDHQLASERSLYAKAYFKERVNDDQSTFDNRQVRFDAGVKLENDGNPLRLGLFVDTYRLDDSDYRQMWGGKIKWSHALSRTRVIDISALIARIKYAGQRLRDVDRGVLGINYTTVLNGRLSPKLRFGVYAGHEEPLNNGVEHLGHDLAGINFTGELLLNDRLKAYGLMGYEYRTYGGADPLFASTRQDHAVNLALGLKAEPIPHWELVPELRYTRSDSKFAAYEYTRLQASLMFLRRFD